jgi:hypothetical protein
VKEVSADFRHHVDVHVRQQGRFDAADVDGVQPLVPFHSKARKWSGSYRRILVDVYRDIITNEESEARAKIARFALPNSTPTARGNT